MATAMNVISITDRENMSNSGAARRLSLLQSARDTANRLLGDAFREMLDRADDMLFAFAEKAENNTQQSLYFDAMRELRTKRSPLHRAFMEGLQHGYDRRCQRGMSNRSPSTTAGATALSLLDDATMEQDITVAGLAERIGNIAREELYALNQRIGSLMNIESLTSEDNPLGPSSIVEAVRDAADCLSVELKIRLIVLKLFERHVAALVPAIYGRVNQHLIDKGVLPTLVTQVRRQPMRAPVHAVTAVADIGDIAVNAAEMLNMITQLVQPGTVSSGAATLPLVPLNVGTMRALTELQQQPLSALTGQSSPGSKFLVELQRGGVLPQMGPAGDMTIDIVAMLFEYILEDRNLPEEFRARLARLQIPVLKVALIDREFFSRKGHPARRLLNLIAECGANSVAEPALARDLVRVVDKIVQQIVTHFDQDIGIFNRGVEVLQSAIEKIRRDAALRTARTTRVVDGRAQLERAKEQARNLVDTRLRPEGVPEVVRNFLLTHWKRLLITAVCKDGEDSEGVRLAIKTMDQLVWSTLPKTGAEDRKKLVRMLPDLLAQLKKGMEELSIPQVARNGFLSKLEKAHSEVIRGTSATAPGSKECAVEPVAATQASMSEMPNLPGVETAAASDAPGGFEMLDITTGEVSGDINELLAAEAERPDAPVEDVPVPVIELEHETGSSAQPVITEALIPARLESTQPDQSEKKAAALRILEQAKSAAEQLRARLDSEDEVKLSEVMPPVDVLPTPAPSSPVNALLDITANTFVKLFSQNPESRGEASQGLEIEELTLGDTRHPALPNPEDQYLDQVKNLKPGTWLELKREDGSTIQARFARYSEETASFNFTDKAGRLVVERTLQGLVADFRRGSVRQLAEPPGAMDRAFTRLLDPSTWRNRNR
jgi:hypothetical protein